MKRFEIVIDRLHVEQLLQALESAGADAHTVLSDASGKGDRGLRSGDELTNVFRNCCVIVAVPVELTARVVEAVRPVLAEAGGMCLVSDCQWVVHGRHG